ncbi:MAG: hypothetical protein EPN88_13420 [Bacteroidetes bacterium]|nr:MAG: hypothetical protein EPN88_13420 [Bacteroidota bacterium]
MKKPKVILLTIAAILIIGSIWIFYLAYNIDEVKIINASASYAANENVIGFNLAKEELTFGTMGPNTLTDRAIFINSGRNYSTKVTIRTNGNLSQYLTFSKNSFILDPNETKKISAYVTFPNAARSGEYKAKVIIQFSKNI